METCAGETQGLGRRQKYIKYKGAEISKIKCLCKFSSINNPLIEIGNEIEMEMSMKLSLGEIKWFVGEYH